MIDSDISGFVFPRRLDRPLTRAIRAEGVWIEDHNERRILDACGGAVVVNLGHGRREVAEAVYEQMSLFCYVHGTAFTSQPVEALAERLSRHTPTPLNRFYFMTSGSEAVETAIKLARQVHIESGNPQRFRLISRWQSYHGLTLGALAASGRTYFRKPFAPMLPEVVHIPPPYCLRCAYGLTYPTCSLRCAAALEDIVLKLGPETVSAFLMEPVSGATLGVYPPPIGYLKKVREICDHYGIILIFDEIMVGMGRTGRWFACQHENVSPDVMVLGKGLTSGALPLSAVVTKSEYMELFAHGSGNFVHGGTFSHHAVAAAAGLAVVKILEEENLVSRVASIASYLENALKRLQLSSQWIIDTRGIGLLWGVEFGKDKTTLEPFPRAQKVAERIRESMFDRGVLVYPATGFAGQRGDAIIIAPPYIVSEQEIDLVVQTLSVVLQELL